MGPMVRLPSGAIVPLQMLQQLGFGVQDSGGGDVSDDGGSATSDDDYYENDDNSDGEDDDDDDDDDEDRGSKGSDSAGEHDANVNVE